MRPARLEINGFASFRDPAVVDFTDADYFALVGPTGSGKSTILDALTFALYGSAYRWGRSNAISYALAPTTNRCTVSLTFDVGQHRYQVSREVRRVGQQIQQKAVSLVRFADRTATVMDPDGPQPEVIAGEIKELNAAIEELLGLSFDDFCQCVVLPQGEFARFLSAGAGDRQKILLKLLGASHYEGIGKRAGAQAAEAGNAITIYSEQLTRHADATPQAEEAAQARVNELNDLGAAVDDLAPRIGEARTQAAAARGRAESARSHIELLTSVTVPDDIDELQQGSAAAETRAGRTREAADAAALALTEAADAAKNGPQRSVLELARDRYTERSEQQSCRPAVEAAAATSEQAAAEAETARRTAGRQLENARAVTEQARTLRDAARTKLGQAQREHTLLKSAHSPEGVPELAGRAAALAAAEAEAEERLRSARDHHKQAAAALAGAGEAGTYLHARRELTQLTAAGLDLRQAEAGVEMARTEDDQAGYWEAAAGEELERALAGVDAARTTAGAAQLRPQLQVGHECPVCTSTVTTLPPPLSDPALEAAQEAAAAARRAHEAAAAAHRAATAAVGERQRRVDTLTERRDAAEFRVAVLLPGRPAGAERDQAGDRAYLNEAESSRALLAAAESQASCELTDAEKALAAARSSTEAVRRSVDAAWGRLNTLAGTLGELNPPTVDATDLADAWHALTSWAEQRADGAKTTLAAARANAEEADSEHTAADASRAAAEEQYSQAETLHTTAVKEATAAAHALAALRSRLEVLNAQLDGAPAEVEVPRLLDVCTQLEAAVDAAGGTVTSARAEADAASQELLTWQTRAANARAALNAARDAVAALSPPVLDTSNLTAGWVTLFDWTRQRTAALHVTASQETAAAQSATDASEKLNGELVRLLEEHGLAPSALPHGTNGAAADAPRVVAVAVERARAEVDTIQRNLAAVAETRTKIEQARARQQVASELAALMRSNKFPQWLADSALDSLVVGASESLRKLSGDQFDLTHHRGEFYVIDHADADSMRSVRTLSGGETFQASLALALALSDELAGIGGATKLESIFLDEGFGTLDPDSLETVAGTLENLAQGDRMVGVITHVAGLAERAPVRFQVHRDTRTSVITREGL